MKYAITALAVAALLSAVPAQAAPGVKHLDKRLKGPSKKIAKRLKGKVIVMDFVETGDAGYSSEFGQALSEIVSNHLVRYRKGSFKVIARRELVDIMEDSIFFGSDPDLMDKLRKKAGMEILISGTYAGTGKEVLVSIKATEAEGGGIVASQTVRIKNSPGFRKMMGRRFQRFGSLNKEDPPKSASLGDMLEVEAGIFYEGGDGKLYPVREGMVLNSKDNYAIYIKPLEDCHLYVYQVDSTHKAFRIFPNEKFGPHKNPIRAGVARWLPNDGEFLYLDENTGMEEIYIFATREPAKQLENVREATLAGIQRAIRTMGIGGTRRSEFVAKVKGTKMHSLELIMHKLAAAGDFYYKLSFIHQE